MLSFAQAVALAVFASYFTLILALFWLILRSIPWQLSRQYGRRTSLYGCLALASFGHTWFYMIKYLLWSHANYDAHLGPALSNTSHLERAANWLVHTELFEQAWFAVCDGTYNWFWSEQLCLFTVGAWTVFLHAESRGSRVARPWAYMLLGQLVAISVASNLFFLALAASPRIRAHERFPIRVPGALCACVAVGLATVYLAPAVLHSRFMPNLLLMHGAITLPLLPLPKTLSTSGMMRATTVYWLVACASLAIRARTLTAAFSTGGWTEVPYRAWKTLQSHPAQSSIGWDVVWTTASFVVYELVELGASWTAFAAPFASIGVTAPVALAKAELARSRPGKPSTKMS